MGTTGTTPFIEFVYPGQYSVVVRGDDWRKIFPLVRHGAGAFHPVDPPSLPPKPIPSPQPNRLMPPPPLNPGDGFTSFLSYFTWEEYTQLQQLTTLARTTLGSADLYDRLVTLLQQLFPRDFPFNAIVSPVGTDAELPVDVLIDETGRPLTDDDGVYLTLG
jgi:hypothetical protein